ncbi:SPOR domain-containing protein [Massilia sp. YIM B02763]|uniref:SPOR domain-containing protein n=1 Tax=Massilia sp. YIM B02763 TaxID=3050130 RepID=UPI0025B6CB85|nr:SPOR domain-containing protein [Massilia sp. YIM B02763]MDN4055828.1 SPOR domain-containing protein [Massilia sp. YIM B02763]
MTAAFRPDFRSALSLRSLSRQRGSTLTGLIIGLIIGLGIAVAVALTITKGASPFTDKTAKSGRPADPAPGQAADPNKPLYGNRDAAREANRALADKATRAPVAPTAPAAPSETKAADADPLGQMIAGLKDPSEKPAAPVAHAPSQAARAPSAPPAPASATAAPPAPAPASGDYIYYLQAGAFRDISDAEATRAKLALLGFEASISDRTSGDNVLHRVRLGPYNQVETMNKARAKLLDSGVDVAIVRNQR